MDTDHLAFLLEFPNRVRANAIGIPARFPMLYWPDRSLCELAFSVFDWLHQSRGAAMGTLKPLAFDLREWLAFCLARGWDPELPDDERLLAWSAALMDPAGRGLAAGRASFKAGRIFRVYSILHLAMPWTSDGKRAPLVHELRKKDRVNTDALAILCGEVATAVPGADPMSTKDDRGSGRLTARRVGKWLRWTGAYGGMPRGTPRPIPTEEQAQLVLERLRSNKGKGVSGYPSYLQERDWLLGGMMSRAGCRADEASRVSLDHLAEMLRAENLLPEMVPLPDGHMLDALASDPDAWRALMAGLERLRAGKRMKMYLPIHGKGGKGRQAPIDLNFVRDLLEVGVASMRRAQLAAWRNTGWKGALPVELLLSDKTRARMEAGSVADLVKHAFGALPGNPHRLRALYAVETAIWVFAKHLKRCKGVTSPKMVEAAHAELAAALGHSKISMTVRWYLGLARECLNQPPHHQSPFLAVIARALENVPGQLSEAKQKVLLKTVLALVRAEIGSEYLDLLDILPHRVEFGRPTDLAE